MTNTPSTRPMPEPRSLVVEPARAAELLAAAGAWPSWRLTDRQVCDLELLLNGAFAPLTGFMTRNAYESTCADMRLPDGTLWPIPVTLDVPESLASQLPPGTPLGLVDREGTLRAVLHVEETWRPDRMKESAQVFGTTSTAHPGVAHLLEHAHPVCAGGRLEGLSLPTHHAFHDLRQTPQELRAEFKRRGWDRVVAFQTRNPMHRAHFELTRRAALATGAGLLLHPVVGATKPGDIDSETTVRCIQALMHRYEPGSAMLSLLPLAMRMGGPREALLHGIIRRNYGCTHLIVGRDHAGPGADRDGKPFYDPYDAQRLFKAHEADLGMTMVPFNAMVYDATDETYVEDSALPAGHTARSISGTQLRKMLTTGDTVPEWFTFPEVAAILAEASRPAHQTGFVLFFTGLPSSGKSTIAKAVAARLPACGRPRLTYLDGDEVRALLSKGLGFSKEDRDLNVRRVGFVAAEVAKHGGAAICALVSPYDSVRREIREMAERWARFVLVYVATPVDVCAERDPKGLYARARAGEVPAFTGVSDPYETPTDANLVVDNSTQTPEAAADQVVAYLRQTGLIS
jgi:sulfate adenylyltransferase